MVQFEIDEITAMAVTAEEEKRLTAQENETKQPALTTTEIGRIRAPIIDLTPASPVAATAHAHELPKRPDVLFGETFSFKPGDRPKLYVTVNRHNGSPYEIFIASRDTPLALKLVGYCRLASGMLRAGAPLEAVVEEFTETIWIGEGYWCGGRWFESPLAHVGEELKRRYLQPEKVAGQPEVKPVADSQLATKKRDRPVCPKCRSASIILLDGCETCRDCGWSKCG